jgi:nitrate/nitrite-specific signal transduction histidine kinase
MDKHPRDKSDFLLRLFEEGKEFTQELLRENERLRLLTAAQKSDSEIKRKRDVPEDALNRLELENRRYKEELEQLRQTLVEVEAENKEFAQKYVSVEQQHSSLASLYVASYQLHSTLDFKQVINIIKEIVINLIGSEMFGIYLKDEEQNDLQLVAQEGLEGEKSAPIPIGVGIIGRAVENGETYFGDKNGRGDDPIACIPLRIQDQLLGTIVIYQLLRQKDGFTPVDLELLSLMADHAATAIYCSQLHSLSERKLNTMQSMLQLLKLDQ